MINGELKRYPVEVNGRKTTLLLTEEQAAERGLADPVEVKATKAAPAKRVAGGPKGPTTRSARAAQKARNAENKARTAENKTDGGTA